LPSRTGTHTHTFTSLCFSRSLSSCLGNIEVILVLYFCLSLHSLNVSGAEQLFKVLASGVPDP
jgi:hypothetical protein